MTDEIQDKLFPFPFSPPFLGTGQRIKLVLTDLWSTMDAEIESHVQTGSWRDPMMLRNVVVLFPEKPYLWPPVRFFCTLVRRSGRVPSPFKEERRALTRRIQSTFYPKRCDDAFNRTDLTVLESRNAFQRNGMTHTFYRH